MKNKWVLLVKTKLEQMRKTKLPQILEMLEHMNTKLNKMIKALRIQMNKLLVKPMELVQVLEMLVSMYGCTCEL